MRSFEDLEEQVIEKGQCTHCGACISDCPDYNIDWGADDRPRRDVAKGMCKNCTECFDKCYKVEGHFKSDEMDKFVFGRFRKDDELLGIYKKIVSAKAKDESLLKKAQDGGIVTTIAMYLLEKNKVDGVIITGRNEVEGNWKPVPKIATNRENLLYSSGSKYYLAPILIMLKEGVIDREFDRLAIIGLPCQIRSARYLQKVKFDLAPAITELIGLFCSKNYEYEKLKEAIKGKGINIKDVKKMDVYGGKFHVFTEDDEITFSLKDMEDWVATFCANCDDYSAEFADIAVGSNGSEKGWSSVIIRTDKGEKLFSELENAGYIVTKDIKDMEEILKNAKNKKK